VWQGLCKGVIIIKKRLRIKRFLESMLKINQAHQKLSKKLFGKRAKAVHNKRSY
jgi:hypothetical protein